MCEMPWPVAVPLVALVWALALWVIGFALSTLSDLIPNIVYRLRQAVRTWKDKS